MGEIHQNGKSQSFEKKCTGRMVNLFELNLGVSPNKLLTDDKPHGSPLARSRSDVSRMSPSSNHMEEKRTVPDSKNTSLNTKSKGTPMKMLIAQEMSKDVESNRNPPNLVAKLMGLDALPPPQQTESAKTRLRSNPRRHSDIPLSYWEQQNGIFHYAEPNEYKDVHEIWEQSQKSSPRNGNYAEDTKRMTLVRQKFDIAKRLSMDVKHRQSKQFHDALEVLNSNKDLFVQCLHEPSSMFSEELYNLQSLPPLETKRITVLKPSKTVAGSNHSEPGSRDGKQIKTSPSNWKNYEIPSQPTRIVVLKPSPGKPHDFRVINSPHSESPVVRHCEEFDGDVEDDENQESREIAKAITQQVREKLGRHRRDETLISSVFSNGYVGDESSFNKSEIDYDAEHLSDSEANSPVSRHSWEYVNRIGSPYSSTFSRASYSPESSVCREAKKRLSERWVLMASNGSYQEQRHVRRSKSTLGEMLALSDAKKTAANGEESVSISAEEVASNNLKLVLLNEQKTDEIMDNSPQNLMRSKSVPVLSTEFGSRIHAEKPGVSKEDSKAKDSKSSFKGKVSSLFFSRSKKPSKDKSLASETKCHDTSSGECGINRPESVSSEGSNHFSLGVMELSGKASFWNLSDKHNTFSHETGFSMSKHIISGNLGENLDQPSPISVLEQPFDEDIHTANILSRVKSEQPGIELSLNSLRSNLIDKSPPIGSIARSLSWDNSCINTSSTYAVQESLTNQGTDEKQEWFSFVETLLSVSGLECEDLQSSSFFAKWHSPDSPLDPSLREKYADIKGKEMIYEAKRRQKRSTRKLAFDCLNASLLEISGYGSCPSQRTGTSVSDSVKSTLFETVWARMMVPLSASQNVKDENVDDNNLVVERVVRKEVAGNEWINELRLEMDIMGKEIEGELLAELVQETVAQLTGRT